MAETIERKCAKCKESMQIGLDNIDDAIYYKKTYYHKDCFIEKANKTALTKRSNAKEWRMVLEQLPDIEKESYEIIRQNIGKDTLNKWLLENYDVQEVPRSFWQLVEDLKNGKYRVRKCKPMYADTLAEMWEWGQGNLNKINLQNKEKCQGPKNDSDRLVYDVAILLKHTNDYKKYLNKVEAEKAESVLIGQKEDRAIDLDIISKTKKDSIKKHDDDISDILNEIFGDD